MRERVQEEEMAYPFFIIERQLRTSLCIQSSLMQSYPLKKTSLITTDRRGTTIKKVDLNFHGIHQALSQATKPIDYYLHKKIQ
ncbi:hypothetical protein AYI68_g5879 [Smittium mucronatum]|uniref:Uncharacterized protein n=1 Tax=Smittium mucronatum TaxID=133383 RepID=A0A1R0GT21_9FUNG|nr:hypothetical protein AYI68_g5879 [Smittium mucronatum]